MSAERDTFDELLGRVSDGGDVDWDRARAERADPLERGRVEALRDVARIAEFSRSVQREAADAGAPAEPLRWGPLLLLERIGSGTRGEVWRAWDPQLKRELAVKMLRVDPGRADAPDALLAEGRALARVRHPNVVMAHGLEAHDGRLGLRMELVKGTSLELELERRGALPAGELARLARELLGALAAVHAAGVLHRDVKPANLVRDDDGRWVLTDFGLGLRRSADGDGRPHSSGTPMFMPPECLDGAPASERSDVYAAGVTLWWAAIGRPPFAAGTFEELRAAARRGPDLAGLARRPDLPPALRATIAGAFAPDTPGRSARAAGLAAALAGAAGRPRTVPARMGLGAVLLLAVVIGGAWLALRAARPTPAAPSPRADAPPAAADAAVPYSVEATLVRHDAHGARALATGDRVRPGDRLSLDFRSTSRVWVYVLDGDERGETYLLYPQPLFERGNPVPADSTVRLPGRIGGQESAWTVTSRGGREHVLLVASPHPLPDLEAALTTLPAPRADRAVDYARIETAQIERLRGVGGVSPLPADAHAGPAPVFERFRDLAGRESGVRGTWVRQVTLENPLR